MHFRLGFSVCHFPFYVYSFQDLEHGKCEVCVDSTQLIWNYFVLEKISVENANEGTATWKITLVGGFR